MPDILERLRGYNPPDRVITAKWAKVATDIHEAADEIERLRIENERNLRLRREEEDAADLLKIEVRHLRDRLETATDLLRNALNVIGVQNDWTVPYQEIRKFIDETDDAAT